MTYLKSYYLGGRMPDPDMTDLVNRFNMEAFDPGSDDGRAVKAALEANGHRRDEASKSIAGALKEFVAEVNRSFAVAVKCEFARGAGGRRVLGRDGVERQRGKVYARIILGRVDAMRVPDASEAARLGATMASDVRADFPGMSAAEYLGSQPIQVLGEAFTGVCVNVTPTIAGDYAETRIGMYFAPIEFKEPA